MKDFAKLSVKASKSLNADVIMEIVIVALFIVFVIEDYICEINTK